MRGRFAPTPSGYLHIGNAFTAVLAWLQARGSGGEFVVRLEDTDTHRCRAEYSAQCLDDLRWLGLDWDEGPDVGGPFGPYVQSNRLVDYQTSFERLLQDECVYPCFCSRAELSRIANAPHGLGSEGMAYPGYCRNLTVAEQRALARQKHPAYRFRLHDQRTVFTDGVAGLQTFQQGFGGDFVVKRADGLFAYQLAVCVDDAAMGVTHVLRGWDLLDSTPRQIQLYRALGLSAPNFTHVPLVVDEQGERLSKRHASLSLRALRGAGTAPTQVLGCLGYLAGWLDRPEVIDLPGLLTVANWASIPERTVVLDRIGHDALRPKV